MGWKLRSSSTTTWWWNCSRPKTPTKVAKYLTKTKLKETTCFRCKPLRMECKFLTVNLAIFPICTAKIGMLSMISKVVKSQNNKISKLMRFSKKFDTKSRKSLSNRACLNQTHNLNLPPNVPYLILEATVTVQLLLRPSNRKHPIRSRRKRKNPRKTSWRTSKFQRLSCRFKGNLACKNGFPRCHVTSQPNQMIRCACTSPQSTLRV